MAPVVNEFAYQRRLGCPDTAGCNSAWIEAKEDTISEGNRGKGEEQTGSSTEDEKKGFYEEETQTHNHSTPKNGEGDRPGREILANKKEAEVCRASYASDESGTKQCTEIQRHRIGQELELHNPWDSKAFMKERKEDKRALSYRAVTCFEW